VSAFTTGLTPLRVVFTLHPALEGRSDGHWGASAGPWGCGPAQLRAVPLHEARQAYRWYEAAMSDDASPASLPRRIAQMWTRHLAPRERAATLAWTSFGATFGVTRTITYSLKDRGGSGGIMVRGRHIHHYNFGIALLAIVGAYAVGGDSAEVRHRRLAIAYGAAIALIVDELALLLDLQDVYWANDGRRSVDVAVGVIAVGGLAVAGLPFWARAWDEIVRTRVGAS
jgi:hypothetical protein